MSSGFGGLICFCGELFPTCVAGADFIFQRIQTVFVGLDFIHGLCVIAPFAHAGDEVGLFLFEGFKFFRQSFKFTAFPPGELDFLLDLSLGL